MKKKIDSIQILRALAALSVVLFHYGSDLASESLSMAIPAHFFDWGHIGVDLFFVISGFIMVHSTKNKPEGVQACLRFIINRLVRILPTYYIILLFAFLTGGAMSTFHYPEKVANLLSAITFTPYLTNTAPLYIDMGGLYNVRWTLNYELYFYLAFGLCMLFNKRWLVLSLWFIAPVFISYQFFGSITLSAYGYNYNNAISQFLTNPLILEFGLGVVAGHLYFALKDKVKFKTPILSVVLFILTAILISHGILGGKNVLSALAFSILILSFSLQNDLIMKYTPRFLITLGNVSFSWYLIHKPIGDLIVKKVEKVSPAVFHTLPGLISLIIISIIFAVLSHRFIETKLTGAIKQVIQRAPLIKKSVA